MARFLDLLLAAPEVKPLLSSEHFSVDGTLLRAWASHSSLERIDGLDDGPIPPSDGKGFGGNTSGKKRAKGDFRGLLLSNQTHRSSTDGQARLFKKAPGVSAFLSFMGHCVLENRNGLVVASEVTQASGTAERDSALQMARSLKGAHQKTLGADSLKRRQLEQEMGGRVGRTSDRPSSRQPGIGQRQGRGLRGKALSQQCQRVQQALDQDQKWSEKNEGRRLIP